MGASLSSWLRWDDGNLLPELGQDNTEDGLTAPPSKEDETMVVDRWESDSISTAQRQPPSPMLVGDTTMNSGPSMFRGAQSIVVNGGTFTVISQPQQGNFAASEEHLRMVLDFFSLVNFRSIQAENLAKWEKGTLEGFIEGKLFQEWIVKQCAILWGTGIPGAVKTILASVVIQYLDKLASDSSDVCVAFVYCRYTEPMLVRDILAALVRQVLERYPHLLPVVESMYQRHEREKTQPAQFELLGIVRYIRSQFRIAFFCIDGLDEALVDEQFDLLDTLSSLEANVIITSRPLVLLKNILTDAEFFEISARGGDVELFVTQRIKRLPALYHILSTDSARRQVIQKICESSRGMFLHASLMVKVVSQCTNFRSVMDCLERLPPRLDVLYNETFKRIQAQEEENADLAKRILTWVVYTFRPLRVCDLQCAIAGNPKGDSDDEANLVPVELLISVCCGLLTVETNSYHSSPYHRTVRLVHYTALDALKRILKPSEATSHCHIAQICIERLKWCGISSVGTWDIPEFPYARGYSTDGGSSESALLEYASEFWHLHAKNAASGMPDVTPYPFTVPIKSDGSCP